MRVHTSALCGLLFLGLLGNQSCKKDEEKAFSGEAEQISATADSLIAEVQDSQTSETIQVEESLAIEAPEQPEDQYEVVIVSEAELRLIPYSSCLEMLMDKPETPSGQYTLRITSAEGQTADVQAYCDMSTDNGGWTLVQNYVHQGATNPPTQVRTTDLPLLNSDQLGDDESNTEFWGHAANNLLSQIAFTEARFYCRTDQHDRLLHFKTDLATCVDYLKTGLGDCIGLNNQFTAMDGHNAFLPAAMNNSNPDAGNQLFVDDVFEGNQLHWALGTGGNNNDWECDNDPDNEAFSTIHRLWIR